MNDRGPIQIRILQVSDIHFGKDHISKPWHEDYSKKGYPTLAKLVIDDLNSDYWDAHPWARGKFGDAVAPIIVAATGDFTQKASHDEFDSAFEFLSDLTQTPIFGELIGWENVFLVPGNHDVNFEREKPASRFIDFCDFYNRVYSEVKDQKRPTAISTKIEELTLIHELHDARVILAEINCCHYVQKDTVDESRGQVDQDSIARLRQRLDELVCARQDWPKIALLHHHPILIPNFIEPGRNVDAIANAKSLLRLLREYGFHAILHGHKHYPHVFTYDPEPAWSGASPLAQLVVAGGSLGSRGLPTGQKSTNTYNLMTIKWDPDSRLARAEVVTRGLKRVSDTELDPDQWRWETLRVYDRVLTGVERRPLSRDVSVENFPDSADEMENSRIDAYKNQRGNMPVVEVLPSVLPGQGYEARVWLVQHAKTGSPKADIPKRVTWSAGSCFPRKVVGRGGAPHFAVSFNYWGATLLQATMDFDDGTSASAEIYARIPKTVGK